MILYNNIVEISKICWIGYMLKVAFLLASSIDCGYMLEPPWRGGFNEYPHSLFWSKNKENRYTYPCKPQFCYMKEGYKGVYISRNCFPDVKSP